MPTSRISGNQIDQNLEITISSLTFAGQSGELTFPKGTAGQRPGSPGAGMLRFNTTEDRIEQYSPGLVDWRTIKGGAGAGGLGEFSIIRGNANNIDEDIDIPTNAEEDYLFENAFTIGPVITINSGNTVTVPVGSSWTIVETGDEPNCLDVSGPYGAIIGPQWTNLGSSDGLGTHSLIRGNPRSISENITLPNTPVDDGGAFVRAYSVGPTITITSGNTVTLSSGTSWEIIS
tara:strand:+ start:35 stop:730 length:696 start_codon:yes stop_codon:yes gene_type:complete